MKFIFSLDLIRFPLARRIHSLFIATFCFSPYFHAWFFCACVPGFNDRRTNKTRIGLGGIKQVCKAARVTIQRSSVNLPLPDAPLRYGGNLIAPCCFFFCPRLAGEIFCFTRYSACRLAPLSHGPNYNQCAKFQTPQLSLIQWFLLLVLLNRIAAAIERGVRGMEKFRWRVNFCRSYYFFLALYLLPNLNLSYRHFGVFIAERRLYHLYFHAAEQSRPEFPRQHPPSVSI